jgi:hypothetical protein
MFTNIAQYGITACMKRCNKCLSVRPKNCFKPDLRNKDGMQGICIDCQRIYKQSKRARRQQGLDLVPITEKKCNGCNKTKSANEFYRDSGISDGHATICKKCKQKSQDTWRENNRERYNARMRAYNKSNYLRLRLLRYKLSPEQYNDILMRQDSKCAICDEPPRGKRPLVVDHDHNTGKVRGLLCYGCNRAIAILDQHHVLNKALIYLESSSQSDT